MINHQKRYLIRHPSRHSVVMPTSPMLGMGLSTNLSETRIIFKIMPSFSHWPKIKSECQVQEYIRVTKVDMVPALMELIFRPWFKNSWKIRRHCKHKQDHRIPRWAPILLKWAPFFSYWNKGGHAYFHKSACETSRILNDIICFIIPNQQKTK